MDIEIGVGLPMTGSDDAAMGGSVAAAAHHAEQVGLDTVSISDVQLGDGTPALASVVAAAVAASTTERVRIEFGVLVLPAREVVLLATQLASLQHVSSNRIVLGVGVGGFPDSPFWRAANVPRRGRGRHAEWMLEVLPLLIAGQSTRISGSSEPVTLAPPAPVPAILVGGGSDVAIRRAVTHGDGWFPSLMSPATLAARVATLQEIAYDHGRPRPKVHFGMHAALGPDAETERAKLLRSLTENFGMRSAEAAAIPITGTATEVADRLAAYHESGADSIALSIDGADWKRQVDTVAEARALLHTS